MFHVVIYKLIKKKIGQQDFLFTSDSQSGYILVIWGKYLRKDVVNSLILKIIK